MTPELLEPDNILRNLSHYGHKIIPFARKAISKKHLSDIGLVWNGKYSVKTAETITNMILGHSFNILPSDEMFYESRFVGIEVLCKILMTFYFQDITRLPVQFSELL